MERVVFVAGRLASRFVLSGKKYRPNRQLSSRDAALANQPIFTCHNKNMSDTMNSRPLAGKVALVTGGSRGIGAATVRTLARQGAEVVFTYLNSEDQAKQVAEDARALGVRAEALRVDGGNTDEVAGVVGDVISLFGRLDILVANAAVFGMSPLADPARDEQFFTRLFTTNLHGVATLVRSAGPHLGDGGRVILISSVNAIRGWGMPAGDYSAAKAGLEAYGRAWVQELGPRGITVNVLQLGTIDTDMVDPNAATMVKQMAPLRRLGRPEEVADAVAYLVGPSAGYITGATLRVDGGVSA